MPLILALVLFVAGLVLAGMAVRVAQQRGTPAGLSLSVILVAVGWWGLSYAVEVSMPTLAGKSQWGDLKYLGICALPPAWLVFVLQYTGRRHLVTRRLLAALCVEPLCVLLLLTNHRTHDLVRFYPPGSEGQDLPVVGSGPVFWVNLVYSNLLVLGATALFVATMVRLSRTYRRMAVTLVVAALAPWCLNVLYNFAVGPFGHLDLTPFAFTLTGGILFWGLFRQRLVDLLPLARGLVVETMADGVVVLDVFGRVADLNPAATDLLGGARPQLLGRGFDALVAARVTPVPGQDGAGQQDVTLVRAGSRTFDVRRQPLPDRGGNVAGELVVLRDVTEQVDASHRLEQLLVERSRIAAALSASLAPAQLPDVPHAELASVFRPAGDGSEIGGDFLDVFPLADGAWGLLLGDVSGKGAEAAAITAMTRYTLRTLADARVAPSRTLFELNRRLLAATTPERFCTLVYAVARPGPLGVELVVGLAGHHQGVVARADGQVETVGELGTVLGLVENPVHRDSVCVLAPGDTLCLFTDGLTEARRGTDMLDSVGVVDAVRAARGGSVDDLASRLVTAATEFSGSQLADDLAILVLRAAPQATGLTAAPALGVTAGL